MKAKVYDIEIEEPKQFKPFEVRILVETIENARLLYHVANHANLSTLILKSEGYCGGCFLKI